MDINELDSIIDYQSLKVFTSDQFNVLFDSEKQLSMYKFPFVININRVELLYGNYQELQINLCNSDDSIIDRPNDSESIIGSPIRDDALYAQTIRRYSQNQANCLVLYTKQSLNDISYILNQVIHDVVKPHNIGLIGLMNNTEKAFYFISYSEFTTSVQLLNVQHEEITFYSDFFSRNSGILEISSLQSKGVLIVGCGSVGSFVSLELARAGIGNFLLIDNDVLQYHNISRHQCGLSDVGRYKVDSVKDRILDINPLAKVKTMRKILEDIPKSIFDEFLLVDSVLIGCADNREGDLYLNRLSYIYSKPFLSLGFWDRACAGEVFYSIPYEDKPCYECLYNSIDHESLSNRQSVSHRFYITDEESTVSAYEPGLSTDITFISSIGVKIALDLINRQDSLYRIKVIDFLKQFTLVCNFLEPTNPYSQIFSIPLQISSSIEVLKDPNCKTCSRDLRI